MNYLLAGVDPLGGEPPADFSHQITNPLLPDNLRGLTGIEFFQRTIPNFVGLAFLVGSLIFFFMFVTGGIQWIMAGGDKANVETARGKLSNALIGLVILFSTFAVMKFIEIFFGVNLLELNIGALKIS